MGRGPGGAKRDWREVVVVAVVVGGETVRVGGNVVGEAGRAKVDRGVCIGVGINVSDRGGDANILESMDAASLVGGRVVGGGGPNMSKSPADVFAQGSDWAPSVSDSVESSGNSLASVGTTSKVARGSRLDMPVHP